MGAHPKAPSLVQYQGQWVSLLDLISKNPLDVLGKNAAKKFNNKAALSVQGTGCR